MVQLRPGLSQKVAEPVDGCCRALASAATLHGQSATELPIYPTRIRGPATFPAPRGRPWKCPRGSSRGGGLLLGEPAGGTSNGAGQAASQAAGPVWLCRPGQAIDPCNYNLAATAVTAAGTLKPATWPRSATASKFDCFYVHPTDSLAKTANTPWRATKVDISVAVEQAAPLSQLCNVWAPTYTAPDLVKRGERPRG